MMSRNQNSVYPVQEHLRRAQDTKLSIEKGKFNWNTINHEPPAVRVDGQPGKVEVVECHEKVIPQNERMLTKLNRALPDYPVPGGESRDASLNSSREQA